MNIHSKNHPAVQAYKDSLTTEEYFCYIQAQKELRRDRKDGRRSMFGMFFTVPVFFLAPTTNPYLLLPLIIGAGACYYPVIFRKYPSNETY